jgi:hypothetical protein
LVALGLATLLIGHPLDPLGRRSLSHLLQATPLQALRVLAGLAFDPAGGLLWAAPLALAALAGLGLLWRRGGPGERAMVVGGVLMVAALLHLVEWRGGDSPPARYLVPLLPLAALAGAMLLVRPLRWRGALAALIPPTLVVSWVAATRPFLLINTGDGSFWLATALARRFETDTSHLFPSLLRLTGSTWAVPAVILAVASCLVILTASRPRLAREIRSLAVAIWLGAAAALLLTAAMRPSTIVELEDPQVRHEGGVLHPPPGTWSRFLVPNGWRLGSGDTVQVPLRLPAAASVRLLGWLDGPARAGAIIEVAWDGRAAGSLPVSGSEAGALALPPPPASGRHTLRLSLHCAAGGSAVLDRVVVEVGR